MTEKTLIRTRFIAERIMDLVADYKPGDQLPSQSKLREHFPEVGANTISNALAFLEGAGLVTTHVYVGTFLANPDDEITGVPATRRIALDLAKDIVSGDLPIGSGIPNYEKTAAAYGVTSQIVSLAVGLLDQGGLTGADPRTGRRVVVANDQAAFDRVGRISDPQGLRRTKNGPAVKELRKIISEHQPGDTLPPMSHIKSQEPLSSGATGRAKAFLEGEGLLFTYPNGKTIVLKKSKDEPTPVELLEECAPKKKTKPAPGHPSGKRAPKKEAKSDNRSAMVHRVVAEKIIELTSGYQYGDQLPSAEKVRRDTGAHLGAVRCALGFLAGQRRIVGYGMGIAYLSNPEDPEPVLPARLRVLKSLTEAITSGTYPVGSCLPSAEKLTGTYRVGLRRAREALTTLDEAGITQPRGRVGRLVLKSPDKVLASLMKPYPSERASDRHQKVLEHLRWKISRLSPEDPLPSVTVLQHQCMESGHYIREALCFLEGEGTIFIVPRMTSFVSSRPY